MSLTLLSVACLTIITYHLIIEPLFINPLSKIPGPRIYALTKWRLALDDWNGHRSKTINKLHLQYGPAIRIGPNEVHFNSLSALRTIYGAGSGYERTTFYRMFDVYGKQNLFTFHSSKQHADRKKLLANAYSKSAVMKPTQTQLVQEKVRQYLRFVDAREGQPDEVFASLHYFSIDATTEFVFGSKFGGTSALLGDTVHQALLDDILHPSRRRLSWFVVHLTRLTRWMYTRVGLLERILRPLLPMQKPATYSGIRDHALTAWQQFKASATTGQEDIHNDSTIMSLLFKHHVSQGGHLEDMDIASECADHLLAGIDTTADTLMFLVWALSRPVNARYQQKLTRELRDCPESMFDKDGVPSVEAADKLEYLNAVIKETLRIYAPVPTTEPRSLSSDSVIDGFIIPARTTVGMSPWSLHRNGETFHQPLKFDPERWLAKGADVVEMNKWFWAFSSGGRMCIGMHLAMAEMTTLVAAIYRSHGTSTSPEFEDTTPAITSRFELFYDEMTPRMKEHECWIQFAKPPAAAG